MGGVNPPFNKKLSKAARPKWLVEWQAIPILEEIGADVLDHPDPRILNSKAGLQITPVIVVKESDTSLTHVVSITCTDAGNPPPGMPFTVTYILYAIFTNVN
jgi:hypothetical protein